MSCKATVHNVSPISPTPPFCWSSSCPSQHISTSASACGGQWDTQQKGSILSSHPSSFIKCTDGTVFRGKMFLLLEITDSGLIMLPHHLLRNFLVTFQLEVARNENRFWAILCHTPFPSHYTDSLYTIITNRQGSITYNNQPTGVFLRPTWGLLGFHLELWWCLRMGQDIGDAEKSWRLP